MTPAVRVGVCEYPTAPWNFGGKERRIRALAEALRALGATVSWLHPESRLQPADVDILQLFGAEYYQLEAVLRAKAAGVRVCLFPILVARHRRHLLLHRVWKLVDPLCPVTSTHRLQQRVLRHASMLFFASDNERQDARRLFGGSLPPWRVIPSTVSPHFAEATPREFQQRHAARDFILAVGRIERRKNPLALLRAARLLDAPVVFVGALEDRESAYMRRFREEAASYPQCCLLPFMEPDSTLLASTYAAAAVHVLPSDHETAGLSNIEALLAGTPVVTTDSPSIRACVHPYAHYAKPGSPGSLAAAIERAQGSSLHHGAREHILATRTHPRAAALLLEAYRELLEGRA